MYKAFVLCTRILFTYEKEKGVLVAAGAVQVCQLSHFAVERVDYACQKMPQTQKFVYFWVFIWQHYKFVFCRSFRACCAVRACSKFIEQGVAENEGT